MTLNRPLFPRGFTLVEVLVSFLIFGILSLIVALAVRAHASNQVKTDYATSLDRTLITTAGRLESLLRGCRVQSPAVGETSPTLQFQTPELDDNGLLRVDSTGAPIWTPTREVIFAAQTCTITGDEPIPVGQLGSRGAVTFERPQARLLRIHLTAGWEVAESTQRNQASLSLVLRVVP